MNYSNTEKDEPELYLYIGGNLAKKGNLILFFVTCNRSQKNKKTWQMLEWCTIFSQKNRQVAVASLGTVYSK